jgi:hypothetical protein
MYLSIVQSKGLSRMIELLTGGIPTRKVGICTKISGEKKEPENTYSSPKTKGMLQLT